MGRVGAATDAVVPLLAYYRAGFRRFSAYRVATAAGAFTNTVFGVLRVSVLMAAIGGTSATAVAGYTVAQASTYAWFTQACVAPISLFGWTELAVRVRTGDIAVDLSRPVDLQLSWLAADLGRASFLLLPRALPPLAVGALWPGLELPSSALPYLLGVCSLALAVGISFACRFAMNVTSFWLLNIRGVNTLFVAVSNLLSGMMFPLGWCPGWLRAIAYATPFPSLIQAPVDVLTGRAGGTAALGVLGVQVFWLAATLLLGRAMLRRATRRLVIQGG